MLSTRYEAVAGTRPRIRHDVLFTQTPQGVLFHTSDGGFQLSAASAYRFATLLVPHFSGEHTVAEICRGFGDKQRAMVGELVSTLYERGFARAVSHSPESADGPALAPDVARRYSAQIAYTDHYADDAERRFGRFRDTRVAVVGDDLVAGWCALSLIRNGSATIGLERGLARPEIEAAAAEARADGCPVDIRDLSPTAAEGTLGWDELAAYDIVVVTGGHRAARTVFPLLRAGVPEGRTLLPAWSFGRHAVVGPSTTRQSDGCWVCAVLRLGANGRPAQAADVWSSLAVPGAAGQDGMRPGRPLAAMLGNLLGYEVFRLAGGALPAETAGQVLLQDLESLDVSAEPLLPHPRCPVCSDPAPGDPAATRTDAVLGAAEAGTALPTVETARDADALVDALEKRSVLLRPNAGVFTRYDDERLTQTPLKLSVVELGIGHGRPRRVAAVDVHHVAGARMRALHRAAEVYAEHVVPGAASARHFSPVRIEPAALALYSGAGGEAADVRAWTSATSVLTKEPYLIPAAAVRPFGPDNHQRMFEATSAGAGAGETTSAAAGRALVSALAFDALRRVVRSGGAVPVRPDTSGDGTDAELTFLMRTAANLGIEAELLDLGERARTGVSVMLARADGRWAVAGDLSSAGAAVSALAQLLGEVQLERQEDGAGADFGDPLLPDLDPRALSVTAGDGSTLLGRSPVAWGDVLIHLGGLGRDALLVPTGSADLERGGIRTVRVLLTSGGTT